MRHSIRIRAMLVAMLLCFSLPATAHHGWSGNTGGDLEITGELITGVSLSGPHGTLQIRDADDNVWNITLAPGPRTHRSGLREDTIPVGAEITVIGERNEDPDVHEAKVRRVIWEDQVFDVYPPQ